MLSKRNGGEGDNMTEEVKEPKYATVVFPPRHWSMKESMAFEIFVRENAPDIKRIFIKYAVISGR